MDLFECAGAAAQPGLAASPGTVQRPGRATRGAARADRRTRSVLARYAAGGNRRQAPGPGGCSRALLAGELLAGRVASIDGVPVFPQPAQRGDLARSVSCGDRRIAGAPEGPRAHTASDAAGECA